METHSECVWEWICCVFCTFFRLLLLVKHKVLQVLALVIVTSFLLLLRERLALSHWREGQVEILILFLRIHKCCCRMLQNDTRAFFTFGFNLFLSLWLTFTQYSAGSSQISWLTQMLRKLFSHFIWILSISSKLVRYGRVIWVDFVVLGIRNVVHKSRLLEGLLISLVVIGETREVVLKLVFESACFIDLKVWFVLYVKQVLSCLYIKPLIGGISTNICEECWQRFV